MNNHLKDEQLIKAISKRHDKYAELQLINRHKRNAFFIAQAFYNEHKKSGISLDEYYSVTLSSIVQAARKFRTNSGKKFVYFYTVYARNELKEYDAENSYLREAKLFAGDTSFDYDGGTSFYNRSKAEELGDIDPLIKGGIEISDIMKAFDKVFKARPMKHRFIYSMYINGCSMKYIASKLNISLSTVYRVIDEVTVFMKSFLRK